VEWWTTRRRPMAEAVRAYCEAQRTGAVTHFGDERFDQHIAASGKQLVNLWDDEGKQLFVLRKLAPERKFDYAMAGCLSWRAYLDGRKAGAHMVEETYVPRRIR